MSLDTRVAEIMRSEVVVDDELDASLTPALRDYNNAMQKLPTTTCWRTVAC
jgi:hypothetical protein